MKQAQPSLLLFQHHFFHEIRTSEVNKHARYRLEIGQLQIWKSDQAFLVSETNLAHLRQLSLVFTKAIPIKCFFSHPPPSCEGGSVGRAKKKKRMNT